MDILQYLRSLNDKSQEIFSRSLINHANFGKAHHRSACVYEFSQLIEDKSERQILLAVCTQLESAMLSAAVGFYRQAFSSLRLSFEMGLAAVYFSANKLELMEWLNGKNDIRWNTILDAENGVLSQRFTNAFFVGSPETRKDLEDKARLIYRDLSEFVHGNNETWGESGLTITYNDNLLERFFTSFQTVTEIILYTLCCRYLKTLSLDNLEGVEFLREDFAHIPEFREYLGGPKEVK